MNTFPHPTVTVAITIFIMIIIFTYHRLHCPLCIRHQIINISNNSDTPSGTFVATVFRINDENRSNMTLILTLISLFSLVLMLSKSSSYTICTPSSGLQNPSYFILPTACLKYSRAPPRIISNSISFFFFDYNSRFNFIEVWCGHVTPDFG